jgi:membrane protease subunit HflK
MPKSNQSGGPWGSGPRAPPDFEEFLRRGQDRLRGLLPGNLGGRGFALIAMAAVVLWAFSGFFRVEPDEVGVVLRFGKFVREVQPGLNYHLPYPIETALTPQALRVNKIDIGFDMHRGSTLLGDGYSAHGLGQRAAESRDAAAVSTRQTGVANT